MLLTKMRLFVMAVVVTVLSGNVIHKNGVLLEDAGSGLQNTIMKQIAIEATAVLKNLRGVNASANDV